MTGQKNRAYRFVLLADLANQALVGNRALVEWAVSNCKTVARAQVVQDDRYEAGTREQFRGVAPYVPGAAGDEDCSMREIFQGNDSDAKNRRSA